MWSVNNSNLGNVSNFNPLLKTRLRLKIIVPPIDTFWSVFSVFDIKFWLKKNSRLYSAHKTLIAVYCRNLLYRVRINYRRILQKPYFHKYWTEIHDVTTILKRSVCSFIVTLNAFDVRPTCDTADVGPTSNAFKVTLKLQTFLFQMVVT